MAVIARLRPGFRLRLPRPKIRSQIVLPFLLLTLLVAMVGTYLSTSLVAGSLEQRLATQLVQSEGAAADAAAKVQSRQLAELRLIANTQGVDDALRRGDAARLAQLVIPLEINDQIGDIWLFNADGRTVLEIDQPDPSRPAGLILATGTSLPSQQLAGLILHGATDALGDKYAALMGTPPSRLGVIGPVRTDGRLVGGVLVAEPLPALIQEMRAESLAEPALFGQDGRLIGSVLPGLEGLVLDASTRAYLDGAPGRAVRRSLVIAGQPYEFLLTRFYLRQQPAAYLSVALSRQAVASAGQATAVRMTVLFTITLLAILLIGYLLALRLTRPIEELVSETRAVARGDLERHIQIRRHDELGELGEAFNAMTTDLRVRGKRLDHALVSLKKISQALTAVTVGTDNLLRTVAHAAAEILDMPYASIHLRKPRWQERSPDVMVGGATIRELAGVRASGRLVAGLVDHAGDIVELDLGNDPRRSLAAARRIGLTGAVGVPMGLDGTVTGVLVVHMRTLRRLERSELSLLQTLANQALIAIENAAAYEQTRQLALTDGLTGVANHREFQRRLEASLQQARAAGTPLSVIVCDVDRFKHLNDTLGHPAGDAVLRYLAQQVILPMLRAGDVVARYGGDEFAIVLAGQDASSARRLAERIRLLAGERPFIYEGRAVPQLSMSLGVSTYPSDGSSRDALILAADQALYEAKRAGRNRVTRSADVHSREASGDSASPSA